MIKLAEEQKFELELTEALTQTFGLKPTLSETSAQLSRLEGFDMVNIIFGCKSCYTNFYFIRNPFLRYLICYQF